MTYTVDEAQRDRRGRSRRAAGSCRSAASTRRWIISRRPRRRSRTDCLAMSSGRRAASDGIAISAASGTTPSIPTPREDARLEGVSRAGAEARVRSRALLPLAQVLGLLGRDRDRSVLSLGVAVAAWRSAASSRAGHRLGRHLPAEGSRGPGHVLHERRLPAWTMQLACSVEAASVRRWWSTAAEATLFIGQNSENLINTADGSRAGSGVPRRVRQEDRRRDAEDRRGAGAARRASAHGQLPRVRALTSGAESAGAARLSGDGGNRHGRAGVSPERGAVLRPAVGSASLATC